MKTETKINRQTNLCGRSDNNPVRSGLFILPLLAFLFIVSGPALSARAQGTAFTYQGRLNDGAGPANGSYDLTFALFDAATVGNQVGGFLTNAATPVSNGLFTVTLDFGSGIFTGADRWLEIGVATNGVGSFSTLTPRQQLAATPYAVRAATAGSADTANSAATAATATVANSVMAANISGTISSNNIAAGSITTAMLADGAVGSKQLSDGAVIAAKMATTSSLSNFTTNTWALQRTFINPVPANGNEFAYSVAVLGTDLLIFGTLYGANGVGITYIVNTNGATVSTLQNPTPAAGDLFGSSAAALGSGRVLVGAPGDQGTGSAYLFPTNNGSLPLVTFNNPAPAQASEQFGNAVAALGNDRVLIAASHKNIGSGAAGSVYLFTTNGGSPLLTFVNPSLSSNAFFGNSIAPLGSDRFIVGAPGQVVAGFSSGAAWLFSTNAPTPLTIITNPSPGNSQQFGSSVAAVGGDKVLVGAPAQIVAGVASGAAYLFSTNGGLPLVTFTNPKPAASDMFGFAVAAVGTNYVLISAYQDSTGASQAGSAYIFSTSGALVATLTNPAPAAQDFVGYALAVLDTNRVVVAAPYDDNPVVNSGTAFLYTNLFISVTTTDSYSPGVVAEGVRRDAIGTVNLTDGAVTSAKISSVDATKLTGTLDDARLSTNVARLNGLNQFTGVIGLNDVDMRFRTATDFNHGLGWYGSVNLVKTFAGSAPDGPILYGFGGGGLGTTSGGQRLALSWNSAGNVSVPGTLTAGVFSGSLNAGNLFGAIPSGLLTSVPAGSLTGLISDPLLSANIPRLNGANVFIATNQFSGVVKASNGSNQFAGTFTGNGSGLTNLSLAGLPAAVLTNNASNVTLAGVFTGDGSGLTNLSNFSLLNGTNVFAGTNQFSGQVIATNANNQFVGAFSGNGAGLTNLSLAALPAAVVTNGASVTGTFTGNGAGLTNLNAATLTGTIDNARLLPNVALLDRSLQTFTGTNLFSSRVGIGTASPVAPLHVVGTNNFPHVKVAAGSSAPFGAFLSIDATATAGGKDYLIFSTGNNAAEGLGRLVFKNQTDGLTILTLSTNGNVGIGTTTPGFPLNFANTVGDKISLFGNSGPNVGLGVQGSLLQIHSDVVTADIAFGYGSSAAMTETMRIKGTGNVGIGTNAPQAKLHVAGNLLAEGTVSATNAGNQFAGTFTGTLYGSPPYVMFSDVKPKGTGDGPGIGNQINLRSFNTNFFSGPTNWFTAITSSNVTISLLQAGTYQCRIVAPAVRVDHHQARLRITTPSTTNFVYGTSEYAQNLAGGDLTKSTITGQFSLLDAPASLVVEHFIQVSGESSGNSLGVPASAVWTDTGAVEVYSVAEFWKIR
jgi:hypothetical protein